MVQVSQLQPQPLTARPAQASCSCLKIQQRWHMAIRTWPLMTSSARSQSADIPRSAALVGLSHDLASSNLPFSLRKRPLGVCLAVVVCGLQQRAVCCSEGRQSTDASAQHFCALLRLCCMPAVFLVAIAGASCRRRCFPALGAVLHLLLLSICVRVVLPVSC